MPSARPRWVQTLRDALKQEHGFGWNVREISGRVQLTRRFPDRTRSSVVLDIPWTSECITPVLATVHGIRVRMEEQGLSLSEAYSLLGSPKSINQSSLDWGLVIDRFEKYKVHDTGDVKDSTYAAAYRPIMKQVLNSLSTKPVPRDAKALLSRLRDSYGGAPGSRARQLRIQYTSQLLRFAVNELGAQERWVPPSDLKQFIGKPSSDNGFGAATPLKDHHLRTLLEGLPDERWYNAIALMACFGLRPVELNYLTASGSKLHIGYSKRTSRGSTAPASIPGLDPSGLPGKSDELIEKLGSNQLILPPLGRSDADVAQSVRQYLNRQKIWTKLKSMHRETGGRLSAYSFRHGFALRAHEMYGLSPRITAALMRHSLQTHVRHYGHWTDAVTIDEALARATLLVGHAQ